MNAAPHRPYNVELLSTARTQIKQAVSTALELGIGKQWASTLRTIMKHLIRETLEWGEPVRYFEYAQLFLCQRLHDRVYVRYAAHEDQRVVFLEVCRPVLGHPLQSSN